MSWTSYRERRAVNVLIYKKINHFVYVNVMSWTSCRGRLVTFTLVLPCFEKINQFVTWTMCRERRVVGVFINVGRTAFRKKKSITSLSEHRVVNVMSCRERLKTFTSVEVYRVVIVMPWTSCRGRLEIFRLVELFFKKNQWLRYVNVESWSLCR